MLFDSGIGDTVYAIHAGEQTWAGVGDDVTRQARMGFLPQNELKEWLWITLHVTNSVNPADIPTEGLSLYQGETRIGGEGDWHLVQCIPAGGIRLVLLTTKPPPH
jgi:hypothetical protein